MLPPAPGTAQWQNIGPTNIGGRMTSIVYHPTNPERIWAGAAGGGVWFSPDAGRSWQPQWHNEEVLNVGALALDPNTPDLIYCGTGEANLSADSYPGVGIYRTLDAGRTWQLFAPSATTGIPRRIGAIAIDPFNNRHIRIGGVGFGEV
ncbi:MAG: WD40/YVTN/BNR-like repeat-containing protein, partial [Candidatus Binatia bacterium]